MEVTSFIVSSRNAALLYGDYATYHQQLSRRILKCRQKLNVTTKHRNKYGTKAEITAQDVQNNIVYLHLLLLTSERGWAQAMSMKTTHAANSKGLAGRARSHIVSRLVKASRAADHVVAILSQTAESGATSTDVLEARAYAALIDGAAAFEKQSWQPCLEAYSIARVIYSSLTVSAKGDLFKDLLSDTIDPSIRYAAYQLKTPRTVPIPTIAKEQFLRSDAALVDAVKALDPAVLSTAQAEASQDAPQTLTWRSREVKIEDAAIAQAWSAVGAARTRLEEVFSTISNATPRRLASAYDDILASTQEAVDATKRAIDELREEGVSPSDHRMQSLQITRTAVNYEMISWRIGRNRVLVGTHDGALEESAPRRKTKQNEPPTSDDAQDDAGEKTAEASLKMREDKPRVKLIRLKEKVALYDGTLHNTDAVKELAGVAADEDLSATLDATRGYFEALKCLAIGRSHAVVAKSSNALALLSHASATLERALPILSKADSSSESGAVPLNIDVSVASATFLHTVLQGEVQRHRALVYIERLRNDARQDILPRARFQPPLIDRLDEYPEGGVDLGRIVELPPTLLPIPAKPIFLDVAWNHIDYPRPAGSAQAKPAAVAAAVAETGKSGQPQKKGWFGFGR